MNDSPKWRVARLEDIERRGRDIPVREHFGIQAFGINAFTPGEDGRLINDHDESGSGQEELYIVLDGTATFEVDGEAFDAPPGTFVFVPPESRRKATGAGTVLALGATPGEAYRAINWGEAWPFHHASLTAYGEQRYADAREAVRDAYRRHGRRDVRTPPAVRRAIPAIPRASAQRRRLRRRARRPAVRGSSSLSWRHRDQPRSTGSSGCCSHSDHEPG
jgi:hypothetical protein